MLWCNWIIFHYIVLCYVILQTLLYHITIELPLSLSVAFGAPCLIPRKFFLGFQQHVLSFRGSIRKSLMHAGSWKFVRYAWPMTQCGKHGNITIARLPFMYFLSPSAEFILGNMKLRLHSVWQHWDGADSMNITRWKTETHLSRIFNHMVGDYPGT